MAANRPRLWTDEFWLSVDPETITVGFHKADPGWVGPARHIVQTDFDVWYVAAGTGEVLVDGRWCAFEAGDLVTLKPGCAYQRERTGHPPFQIYFAHLLPFGRDDRGLNEALGRVWPQRMSLLHRPDLVSLFDRYFEAHATRPNPYSLAVKGLALQVLHVIFEELQRPPSDRPPRGFANLLRAKEMIERNYARDLWLYEMAKHSDLSPSHLSALFTQHLGCPPIEYLLRVRLREAKLLLARGARVKEVAHAVGFHSQHYFSRLFKKRTGLSPIEFSLRHAGR